MPWRRPMRIRAFATSRISCWASAAATVACGRLSSGCCGWTNCPLGRSMSLFLIAEIGINHNGSVDIAKQLIDAAVDAGFDAVKFQKRTVEKVYAKEILD